MTSEKQIALDLVSRLAHRFGPASRIAKEVPGWIEYLTDVECPERPRNRSGVPWWGKVRGLLDDLCRERDGGEGELVRTNTAMLGAHFGLDPVETQVLAFFAFYQIFDMFEHVVDHALRTKEITLPFLIARFCDSDEGDIRAALRPKSQLRVMGLLLKGGGKWVSERFPFGLSSRLAVAMLTEVDNIENLVALLFPPAPPPEAEWLDFEGLKGDAALMRDLIARSLASGTPGVNILLYGAPGTGKTEFCKVLAGEVGAKLRALGEIDDEGQEPSRHDRLAELGLAGRMLAARRDTVLLLDEMEDLFGGGASMFVQHDQPSKVFLNRLLETNPVPTLWTTNSIASCDPAFLRRMTFSVEMRAPSGQVRKRIWRRLEERHQPSTGSGSLVSLAEVHDHAPALVSDAMRVARLCGGTSDTFTRVLGASAKLMNGGVAPPPQHHSEAAWEPAIARTDTDLVQLAARLAERGSRQQISFCLDGPAGTGKSAWARHFARQLGLPVIQKRASDILSMWVGGSEKAIACAFSEARAEGAVLIFDEADSLLADRRNANYRWEISQVNEMLTWMESHPLPFVCTTNLAEKLDPATQRRFTFRIRFDWLTGDQLAAAWKVHFDSLAPRDLLMVDRLTPGDFAKVARRMRVLGQNDPAVILAELVRESEAKEGKTRVIGFGR